VAVDAAVLGKRAPLDESEWQAIRRHPRLSARLLTRFGFATVAARAVEYHHERYDGRGYYGIEADEIPLGAHMIAVADSFDAMVADRPYRRGLDPEQALAEIERGSGTQFHPIAAQAFVAMWRGHEPLERLDPAARAALRDPWLTPRRSVRGRLAAIRVQPWFMAIAGTAEILVAVSIGRPVAAVAGGSAVVVSAVLARRGTMAGSHLADSLDVALDSQLPAGRFHALAAALARKAGARWVGLASFALDGQCAIVAQSSHGGDVPVHPVGRWLTREGQDVDSPLELAGSQLGCSGTVVAVPARRGNAAVGYLVVSFPGTPPQFARDALGAVESRLDQLLPAQPRGRSRVRALATS